MRDRSSGRPSFKEKPSNVRILLVDILTFDGFFGVIFDILTPNWLPTARWRNGERHFVDAERREAAVEEGEPLLRHAGSDAAGVEQPAVVMVIGEQQ